MVLEEERKEEERHTAAGERKEEAPQMKGLPITLMKFLEEVVLHHCLLLPPRDEKKGVGQSE